MLLFFFPSFHVWRIVLTGWLKVDREGRSCLTDNGGTTLLASHGNVYGPGGQGVFEDSTRGFVLYYHYADRRIGLATEQYQFGWNVLQWADGWPTV